MHNDLMEKFNSSTTTFFSMRKPVYFYIAFHISRNITHFKCKATAYNRNFKPPSSFE